MIPLEVSAQVQPRSGELLVERMKAPLQWSGLHLPPGYREHERSAEAIVVASSVDELPEGTCILLAPGAQRSITFGMTETRTLWLVRPEHVLCRLVEPNGVALGDPSAIGNLDSETLDELEAGLSGYEEGT